jgi:uncharacterized coiled-coil DUF342 family protein
MLLEDAAKEREEYLAKVNHLQEAIKTNFSALNSLRQQAAQYREEKEEAERAAEELKLKYRELEAGSNLLQDKLRLYSGGSVLVGPDFISVLELVFTVMSS